MATALVLGATGHIGAHIVRALLAENHIVRAAYRRETYLYLLEGLPVQRVRVDLESGEGLAAALQGCDWVFQAAGFYPGFRKRRNDALNRGIDSTRRFCDAARAAGIPRVVFTSSASTIQEPPDPQHPRRGWRALYAAVKTAMEREVLRAAAQGLPAVITNPSVCLGEYDAHPFSGQLILAYAKHRLPLYLHRQVNVIYTGDVGVGHVRAAERGRLGERYPLTTAEYWLRDFAALVAQAAGTRPPRWAVPDWLYRLPPRRPLDGAKAVQELGLPQTPIEEAVRRALQWFRAHHYV